MCRRIIIILLLIPVIILTTPLKLESYNMENILPQEALKASGASFNEIRMIQWTKYKKDDEAIKLRNIWQKILSHNNSDITHKIIIQPGTHYVIAEIKSNHIDTDINQLAKNLAQSFLSSKNNYQSIIYQGYFRGPIDKVTQNNLILKIKRLSNAKQIDSYTDKQNFFWSGYTPLIKDELTVEGKKMNLNIAMRYNALEDKTYIFIGTPIITMEY